jgi:glycosyltransferase involved in cell wall biosynthesis
LQVNSTQQDFDSERRQPVGAPLTRDQLAVVIPARNEARSLRAVAEGCLTQALTVIVVDDASIDGTLAAVSDLPLTTLRSDLHLGKGGALSLGFHKAVELGAQAVMTLDGDGQHDSRDIPAFLAMARQHPGALIVGARMLARTHAPLARRLANRVADFWISRAAGRLIRDSQCGQRLYPRELLLAVRPGTAPEDGFVFESELLIEAAWQGFGIVSVPIKARFPENLRSSHFRPVRDIWRITRMVARKTYSSERPLSSRVMDRAVE